MAADDASTRFPFISLEKALPRAHQLFMGDKNGKPMPLGTAFELWNYSPKSSGGLQTVAALKGYGLLEDEGSSADRKVKISSAARRYFLDERDDVRASMLAEFALSPPLFRVLWVKQGWSEGIPADTVARSYLKLDRHLSEQSARALLGVFKETIRFAGLKSGVPADPTLESEADAPQTKAEVEPDKGTAMHTNSIQATSQQPPATSSATGGKPIVFDMESVTVSARFENAEDLRDFIEKLKKLEPLMPAKH